MINIRLIQYIILDLYLVNLVYQKFTVNIAWYIIHWNHNYYRRYDIV